MEPYYENENGKLYHGDCYEIVTNIEDKINLVITDPPYEIGAKGCGLAGDRKYLKDITSAKIDKGFDSDILKLFGNWFCFCSFKQLPEILKLSESGNNMLITWGKTNPTPLVNNNYLPDTEYIIHRYEKGRLFGDYKDKSRFIVLPVIKYDFNHPTIKPIGIIHKLLSLGSKKNETVLDPFLGSGTTAIACEGVGRKWIGIEKEEKYCEIAAKRIEAENRQLKLF